MKHLPMLFTLFLTLSLGWSETGTAQPTSQKAPNKRSPCEKHNDPDPDLQPTSQEASIKRSPAYFHTRLEIGMGGTVRPSGFSLALGLSFELDLFRWVGIGVFGGATTVKESGPDSVGDMTIPVVHGDLYVFVPIISRGSIYLSVGGGFSPDPDDPLVVASIGFRYWLNPYLFVSFAPSCLIFIGRTGSVLMTLSLGLTVPGRR